MVGPPPPPMTDLGSGENFQGGCISQPPSINCLCFGSSSVDDIIQETSSRRAAQKLGGESFPTGSERGRLLPFLGTLAPMQAQPKPQPLRFHTDFSSPLFKAQQRGEKSEAAGP